MIRLWLCTFSLFTLLLLGGCSATTPENEATEVTKASLTVSAAAQLQLLKDAQESYEKELYTVARENFEKLRNSYPLGPYAEFAEIKIADSHYVQGQYSSAAAKYENFVKEHPASASLEYALIMAARSFQLSNRGIGRDPSSLNRALEFYNRVITDFPLGVYKQDAAQFRIETMVLLAQHERKLLEYYRRNNSEAAYSSRLSEFKIRWKELIRVGLVDPVD